MKFGQSLCEAARCKTEVSFRGRALLLAALGLFVPLGGCESADEQSLEVLWELVDGRSCVEAGAVRAVASVVDFGEHAGRCSAVPSNNRISIPTVRGGTLVRLRAESAESAVLYRGETLLPAKLPSSIAVVLSYSGGL